MAMKLFFNLADIAEPTKIPYDNARLLCGDFFPQGFYALRGLEGNVKVINDGRHHKDKCWIPGNQKYASAHHTSIDNICKFRAILCYGAKKAR